MFLADVKTTVVLTEEAPQPAATTASVTTERAEAAAPAPVQ